MPLSATEKSQVASSCRTAEIRTTGGCSPRNLMALLTRFWNSDVSSENSARTVGSSVVSMTAPDFLYLARQVHPGLGEGAGAGHQDRRALEPPDPAEGQQVVDQRLHPLGAVHGVLDVLVRPGVELADIAALEQLAEARHLAQRLLEVVRGHVGELLELGYWTAPGQGREPRG